MSEVVSNPYLITASSTIRNSFVLRCLDIAIARIEFTSGGALVDFDRSQAKTMKDDEGEKGFLWRLPKLQTHDWGKMGPAFGYGIGCGVGLGAGIVGGAGVGLGFPGLQVGFGAGAGCGVGVGFGYGLGKGRAYDDNGTYSNIGRLPKRPTGSIAGSTGAEIGAIVDDLVSGLKRALNGIQSNDGKRP